MIPFGELTDNFDALRAPVKESDRRTGPYPYYGASGVVDHVDGFLFDGEYLLVAEDGENLKTRQTPIAFTATGKFWVNNHAHIVRANTHNVTRYLMYAMRVADLASYLTGSTMPKLTQANMNRIPVLAPPREKQAAIAAVLGTLDDKIELNRRMNETLEAMARALFKSWFVDFDPVRAKAEGRVPSGMDAETARLFPSELVESEMGDIPKGWRVGAIAALATLERGAVNPLMFPAETFDHYSLPSFDAGRTPKLELGSAIMSNKLMVPLDSVLLSKLNPHIPRIWLPDIAPVRRSVCSTEFLVLSPKKSVSRYFLFSLLTSDAFSGVYRTLVTGTTGSHQRVNAASVLDMHVVLPPPELAGPLSAFLKPLFERINRNAEEGRTTSNIRDALLPRLLSGELNVNTLGVTA